MTARDLATGRPGLHVAYQSGAYWAHGRVAGYHRARPEIIVVQPDEPLDGWLIEPDQVPELEITWPEATRGWGAAYATVRLPTPEAGWPHACARCGCPAQIMFNTVLCSSPPCWT